MALSKDQVVGTAVDVLRRYGLADLTMRRLARELGVQPGALYWHVASKQELLVDVAAQLLDGLPVPDPDAPPTEALADHARALREAVRHVPDGADVVALAHAVDPGSLPALTTLVALVGDAGVPRRDRDAVAALVLHHVLGSVTTEHDRRTALDANAASQQGAPGTHDLERSFETGLAVVLAGLASR